MMAPASEIWFEQGLVEATFDHSPARRSHSALPTSTTSSPLLATLGAYTPVANEQFTVTPETVEEW